MVALSPSKIRTLPHSELIQIINRIKEDLKSNKVVQDLFEKYGIPLAELDLVPICFKDLEVSARTEHGVIFLNWKLLEEGSIKKIDHYIVHELTHYCQQTTGDGPTKGSTEDSYLDNPYEIEGFNNQSKYLSDTRDDGTAEKYINKVLKHHDVSPKEKHEKKEDLLRLAHRDRQEQLNLFPQKIEKVLTRLELLNKMKDFSENFEVETHKIFPEVMKKKKLPVSQVKLPEVERKYRLDRIREILDSLSEGPK